jgi:predicted site-specific integrase-resolvase
MKRSEYAKQRGISYRTAFRWWQAEQIPGYRYQAATGTLIVVEPKDRLTRVGFRSLDTLLTGQGQALAAVNEAEHETDELRADLTSTI